MIAFGSSITVPEVYERCAGRGIRRAAEPDSVVFANAAAGSIPRSYNLILEKAAEHRDLEAVVLLHQDAEIVDADFGKKLRGALADPDVAVVGCAGARGVRGIAWWEGSLTAGSYVYHYGESGGGELRPYSWNGAEPSARAGEVDTVDGVMLGLSPWAVRNVRFDESLGVRHGYDFDYCLQVRGAGRKAVAEDIELVHHHALVLVPDPEPWMEAHMRVAEKWDGRIPGVEASEEDWKARARRAEGEAAAARLLAASKLLLADAGAKEHESRLRELTNSMSWRITEPLRRLRALRRPRDGGDRR